MREKMTIAQLKTEELKNNQTTRMFCSKWLKVDPNTVTSSNYNVHVSNRYDFANLNSCEKAF